MDVLVVHDVALAARCLRYWSLVLAGRRGLEIWIWRERSRTFEVCVDERCPVGTCAACLSSQCC